MTIMVRCLEGHAFDIEAAATCPICGSGVWRDAVKGAAEKAAREAGEAKAAKEALEMDNKRPNNIVTVGDRDSRFKNALALLRSMPGSLLRPLCNLAEIQAASTIGLVAATLQTLPGAHILLLIKFSGRNDDFSVAATIGASIPIALYATAAYRFEKGKGLVIGSIILVLSGLATLTNLIAWKNDTQDYLWVFFGIVTAIGDWFGIRAAWANRKQQRQAR